MKKWILSAYILCMSAPLLMAQAEEHKTPEQIEQELQSAESQFQKAKKMFNPWYTGPILTPGATMMPPGWGNLQPYIFVNDNYARYDEDRHSQNLPSHLVTLNPAAGLIFGVTKSFDLYLSMQGFGNWQYDHSGGGFGDTGLVAGFLIASQTIHVPAIKFSIKETFPTGSYNHLNHNGYSLSATGGGCYQTQFTLAFSKVTFWDYLHPLNFRAAFSYNVPKSAHVHGFNTYGGGFGTNAKVLPGNTFSLDAAFELSLTQRWVFATDLVYSAQNATHYHGHVGLTAAGDLASMGGGYNDNLSLAPAIEYNWSPNIGVLGGVWFSVYGRNSSNFVNGVISVTWSFQVN